MNRPQLQITQYFNRLWEAFFPHFNPLWALWVCRRWLVGSPPAHVVKGYLVLTCFFHVPARAEGTGRTIPFASQVWALYYSCPSTHSSPLVSPIACVPNGSPRRPGPSCQLPHRHRTTSSAEDLAISQVSDHKLSSCLPAPRPCELAQVLANLFHSCFRLPQGGPRGELLSHVWKRTTNAFVSLSKHWGGGCLLYLHHFSLYLSALLQLSGWRMICSLSEVPCAKYREKSWRTGAVGCCFPTFSISFFSPFFIPCPLRIES